MRRHVAEKPTEMKMLRPVLCAITLAAALPSASAQAPATGTPAPTKPVPKSPPRAPTLVSVTAEDEDFAAGAAPEVPKPASAVTLTASASVPPSVLDQIRSTPHAQREALVTEIGSRIDAAQKSLVALRSRVYAPGQRNDNAFVFQRAFAQARTCEQTLRKNLQAARGTKTASTWPTVQAALTRTYSEYAKAVADVESAGPRPVALVP